MFNNNGIGTYTEQRRLRARSDGPSRQHLSKHAGRVVDFQDHPNRKPAVLTVTQPLTPGRPIPATPDRPQPTRRSTIPSCSPGESLNTWIKHTYGGRLTPREKALKHFPFKVPTDMTHASPYRRLRDHGEFVATSGIGMSADKLKRLRTFYRNVRDNNLVVASVLIQKLAGLNSAASGSFRAL